MGEGLKVFPAEVGGNYRWPKQMTSKQMYELSCYKQTEQELKD